MTVHTPIEARSRGIPGWAIGITVFILLVGAVYFAGNLAGENPPIVAQASPSGSVAPNLEQMARGIMDRAQCAACHGQDLTGDVGPSLHGIAAGPKSPNLQELAADHPEDWIVLWIDGTVPEVRGIDRMGMPAFGESLTREEIQAVADYLLTLE
ncbi:MAG TPA: cytochrome c [Candidatus Limnocylindria bacterium]|nr:cytochrome c [Candidatus Limnocylindria bacterium]